MGFAGEKLECLRVVREFDLLLNKSKHLKNSQLRKNNERMVDAF